MPQLDRHKKRVVNIEFVPVEEFRLFPYPERYTLTYITSGSLKGRLNGRPIAVDAPAIFCLTGEDRLQVTDASDLCAQSFCFHDDFLKSNKLSDSPFSAASRIRIGLSLFQRNGKHDGIPRVTGKAYPLLFEWFFILGTEVQAQSDALWACRIKKYLIQIMGLLEELSRTHEHSPVEAVLDYIHTHYARKITLQDLTNCAHLNRMTLNKLFQERCGKTAMGYLLSYRVKMASEMLTHTDMSLNEIAQATGYEYDTYLIKHFTAKMGMSPTTYRISSRQYSEVQ